MKPVLYDPQVKVVTIRRPGRDFQIDAAALDAEEAAYWLRFARRQGWPEEVVGELERVFRQVLEGGE